MRAVLLLVGGLLAGAPATAEIRLFDQRGFQGRQVAMERESSNMSFAARSAKLVGASWEICPRPFFGGNCLTLESDQPNLNLPRAFSGTIRSARPKRSGSDRPAESGKAGAETEAEPKP
jgi:hypothetical protein